jgi:hypothetical protein
MGNTFFLFVPTHWDTYLIIIIKYYLEKFVSKLHRLTAKHIFITCYLFFLSVSKKETDVVSHNADEVA